MSEQVPLSLNTLQLQQKFWRSRVDLIIFPLFRLHVIFTFFLNLFLIDFAFLLLLLLNIETLVHPRSDVYSMDVNLFENDVMVSKNQILQVSGQSSETEGLWSLSTRATSPREF